MPNPNRYDILSISIFCKIALSISIPISIFSKITISISIFLELPYRYRYRYRYFSELPYRYRYRYRYFSKVSIYRQSICHIDISNRATSRDEEEDLLRPGATAPLIFDHDNFSSLFLTLFNHLHKPVFYLHISDLKHPHVLLLFLLFHHHHLPEMICLVRLNLGQGCIFFPQIEFFL